MERCDSSEPCGMQPRMSRERASDAAAWIFRAALLVALVWEIHRLFWPPHGEHAWRDADGIGVARSFLREGWDLLHPRVAERGASPGVTGMELPLVPFLSALAMRA